MACGVGMKMDKPKAADATAIIGKKVDSTIAVKAKVGEKSVLV